MGDTLYRSTTLCVGLKAGASTGSKDASLTCIIAPFMLFPAFFGSLFDTFAPHDFVHIFDDWREDSLDFLRYQAPRIVAIIIVSFILARLLKVVSRHLAELGDKQMLPSAVRAQQLRTLSSVIYSVGVFIIGFLATMQILTQLNVKVAAAGQRRYSRVGGRVRGANVS